MIDCYMEHSNYYTQFTLFQKIQDMLKQLICGPKPLKQRYCILCVCAKDFYKKIIYFYQANLFYNKKDKNYGVKWQSQTMALIGLLNWQEFAFHHGLIDIKSIDNIDAKSIISKFNRAGIRLFIKDFSNRFEIPIIGILAYDSKGGKCVKIYCAAGTSLNKDIALIRALAEIAQHRCQTLFKKHNFTKTQVSLYIKA